LWNVVVDVVYRCWICGLTDNAFWQMLDYAVWLSAPFAGAGLGGARYEEKRRKYPGLDISEALSGLRRDS